MAERRMFAKSVVESARFLKIIQYAVGHQVSCVVFELDLSVFIYIT